MVLCMQGFQTLACNVGVNGGGGNIGMPQQHLHRSQVSAMVEQMCGERVSQSVGGQRHLNVG
jgi:hypothetical protein